MQSIIHFDKVGNQITNIDILQMLLGALGDDVVQKSGFLEQHR